ncbi:efflux RND transporter periplasmic adaptor subunit [Affinibrenneria salicis]|uniref:Efflux RND transporter periplasmic adaptor subunit n=1 Tax=Affinibrenneria salicis TaxID=2590031 RepID=A0A5J5G548_9GAMM|nr:efflux RND transporter periplasmic adaptor subunit [Affinibrenneria salicis]KAA9001354.1 efflux RND transporter periplasmic adaptor subunit [Affinibrenneria salicis]
MFLRRFFLLAIVTLAGCDNPQIAAPQAQPVEVGIVSLRAQPYSLISELPGRTVSAMTAQVRPQVGGLIMKRLFREGDDVQAGQALYQIDPGSYQAAVDQAAAALKNAQALLRADCAKANRYAQLAKTNDVSRQDADDARAVCEQDQASESEKKAALESARIQLAWTTIAAPISGRIGISSVTPGALVTAQQDSALATIRALDTMYVDVTRASRDLLRLRKQALATNNDTLSVTLILEDGTEYAEKGRLALTEVAVDEATGSVTLRAVFPNPQHLLLPGMYIRAKINEGVMENAILAPQRGISRDAKGNATALVVTAENKVEKRQVETGDAAGDRWLVLKGLQNGDRLITEGTNKVAPGQQVAPVDVERSGGQA